VSDRAVRIDADVAVRVGLHTIDVSDPRSSLYVPFDSAEVAKMVRARVRVMVVAVALVTARARTGEVSGVIDLMDGETGHGVMCCCNGLE
jgi:hypothetical protein